nr:MAG TPA: hypothetical protein [Microviridae sp.]
MVDKARDTIHRHRPSSLTLDVEVGKHLIRHRTCNSKYTVNIGLILTNPRIRQLRELGILIGKMPDIQRGRSLRAHLTSNTGRLVTVIGPGFLITKDLIVLGGALGVNFLVQNRLLTDISEDGEIVVQAITAGPETLKALLVGMVIAGDHNADHKAMLNKGLNKITMNVSSNRESGSIAERSAISLGRGILDNLIDINRYTVAAKILRTLEASIGRGNAKMRLEDFNVTCTSSCILLVEFLDLKGHAQLVDSGSRHRTRLKSPQVVKVQRAITGRTGGRPHTGRVRINLSNRGTSTAKVESLNNTRIIGIALYTRSPSRHRGLKERMVNTFGKRNNGKITTLADRNGYIRAFLRSRQGGSEVVMELGSLEGHTAFDNIDDIVGAIGTCKDSIIHRDVEGVREVLIAKPLIHDEGVGTEGEGINREVGNTSRDAHIVSKGANRPATRGRSHLGHGILHGRNPGGLSVLAHELTPMLPYDTVGHKIKISVQVKIIHHGSKQSLQTGNHGCLHLESITGKNFIHIEGNNVSDVEAEFNAMVTPKSATSNIKVSRIKSKSCIFITRQVNTSSL